MSWPTRKLHHDEKLLAERAVSEVRGRTTWVVCPRCDRYKCPADVVCWVPGEGWACDVCRRHLERDRDTEWTRPKLMRAMGAPADEVRQEYVKVEARRRFIRHKHMDLEGAISRQDWIERMEEKIPPASEGYPEGTELPEHARAALEED